MKGLEKSRMLHGIIIILLSVFNSLHAQSCPKVTPVGISNSSVIPNNRIVTSSELAGHGKEQIRLNCCRETSGNAWCPDKNDKHPFVEIHLEKPVAIGRIAIQIPSTLNQYPANFMKSFDLLFKLSGIDDLITVAEDIGAILNNTISLSTISLNPAINTDIIRIEPKTFENMPCFRMELYKCDVTSLCSPNYCQNSGTCSGPNTCSCTASYFGARCQYSKQTIPVTVYRFLQIVTNTIITTSYNLTFAGDVTLDADASLLIKPGGYINLNTFSTDVCLSDLNLCYSGFTITLQFSFSNLEQSENHTVLTNGAGIQPNIKGVTLFFRQGQLECHVVTSTQLWKVTKSFILAELKRYEITISWSPNQGLLVLQDNALIGSVFTPLTLPTRYDIESTYTIGYTRVTSTAELHLKTCIYVPLFWEEVKRADIFTDSTTTTAMPKTSGTTSATRKTTSATEAAVTAETTTHLADLSTTKSPEFTPTRGSEIIEYFWNLTSISQTVIVSHDYQLIIKGNPTLGVDGIRLNGVDQQLEIPNLTNSCLTNPSLCTEGLTIQIQIQFIYLEEDTFIFTTGADKPYQPGVTLVYRYGYIHAIVSTTSQSWYVSVSRTAILSNDFCNIVVSWSQHTTLQLIINQVLVGVSEGPIPHLETEPTSSSLTIGGGSNHCVISQLHIWHMDLEILIELGLVSCNVCTQKPNTTPISVKVSTITVPTTAIQQTTAHELHTTYYDECPAGCIPSDICFGDSTTPTHSVPDITASSSAQPSAESTSPKPSLPPTCPDTTTPTPSSAPTTIDTPKPSSPPITVETTTPNPTSPPTTEETTTPTCSSPACTQTTTPKPSPPPTEAATTPNPTSPPTTEETTTPKCSSPACTQTTTPKPSPPPTTEAATTPNPTSAPTTGETTTPKCSSPACTQTTTPKPSPPPTTEAATPPNPTSPPTTEETTTPKCSSPACTQTTTPKPSPPPTTEAATTPNPTSAPTTGETTTPKCSSPACTQTTTPKPSPPPTTEAATPPNPTSPPTTEETTTPKCSSPACTQTTTPKPSPPPTTEAATTPNPTSAPTTEETTTPKCSSPDCTQTTPKPTTEAATTPKPSPPTTEAATTPVPTTVASVTTQTTTTSTTTTTRQLCPEPSSSVTLTAEVNANGQGQLTCSLARAPMPGTTIKLTWRIEGESVFWNKFIEAPDRSATLSVTEIHTFLLNKKITCRAEVKFLTDTAEWCWPVESNTVVPSVKCPPVNGTVTVVEGREEQILHVQITVPPSLLCQAADNGQCRVEVTTTIRTDSNELKCSLNEIIPQAVLGVTTVGQSGQSSCGVAITPGNWQNSVTIPIKATVDGIKDNNRNKKLTITVRIVGQVTLITESVVCGEINIIVIDRDEVSTCSSVNDPHIKTYDNIRYNNFIPGEFVLHNHISMQNEVRALYRPCSVRQPKGPTCNCGAAVRAGDDVITFDTCNTRQNTISPRGNSVITVDMYKNGQLTPGTRVLRLGCGQKYEVYLPTGTKVTITASKKPFMNINIQASSYDFERTEGLCGSFNNVGADDLGGHSIRHPDEFSKLWKRETTIFKGVSAFSTPAKPVYCSCQSGHQPVCRQGMDVYICGSGSTSSNDITAALISQAKTPVINGQTKTHVSQVQSRGRRAVDDDAAELRDLYNEESATQYCKNYLENSPAVKNCLSHLKYDAVTESIRNCAEDLVTLNDTDWAVSHVDDLIVECLTDALANVAVWENNSDDGPSLPSYITSSLCVVNCTEHGRCVRGICECDPGWTGETCQIGSTTLPTVFPALEACDLLASPCTEVLVEGNNFVQTDNLTCKIRYISIGDKVSVTAEEHTVPARFVSMIQVVCPLAVTSSSNGRSAIVTISNDGVTYSTISHIHIVHKSACQTCNLADNIQDIHCAWKVGSCIIDNQCYSRFEPFEDNKCYWCDPDINVDKWTKKSDPNCTDTSGQTEQLPNQSNDDTAIIVLGVLCGVLALAVVAVAIGICKARAGKKSKSNGFIEREGSSEVYRGYDTPSTSADISGHSQAARINAYYNPTMSS